MFRVNAMQPMPPLDRNAFIARLRQKLDDTMGQVADAVNAAPDGSIIAGSECQVRDLFADLRRQTFELALQMKTDAAEAAFSPSAGRRVGEEPSQ